MLNGNLNRKLELLVMIPSILHGQQSNMPTVGLRMGHENNFHGSGNNDYLHSSNKEGSLTGISIPSLQ